MPKSQVNKMNLSKFEMNPPELYSHLRDMNSQFIGTIDSCVKKAEKLLDRITETFPNYTCHDIDHSIRICDYIFEIIDDINELSELEIAVIILSCVLHDIGMFTTEEERENIKDGTDVYSNIDFEMMKDKYGSNENLALQNIIRIHHGVRSSDIILSNIFDEFIIPSQEAISFANDLALICESHTRSVNWAKHNLETNKLLGSHKFNPLFCSILLRLGDILDFDSNRTPLFLYKILSLHDTSKDEWLKHFCITNNEKVFVEKDSSYKKISFYGECDDPGVHRNILKYFELINNEIKDSISLTSKMNKEYSLKLKYPLEDNIKPKGYSISDLRFNIDYFSISNLLMGENIYGDKSYGLRELIQNSIDACLVRRESEDNSKEAWDDNFQPKVDVIIDEETFSIKDNGTGMSFDMITNYFLSIGKSYYQSDEFKLKGMEYSPIGKFGIGFLSCFMLSDEVKVKTRHYKDKTCYHLDLVKSSEFICMNEIEDITTEGTEVILSSTQVLSIFDNDVEKVVKFISENFLTDAVSIRLIDTKNNNLIEINNSINEHKNDEKTLLDLSRQLRGVSGLISYTYANYIDTTPLKRLDYDTGLWGYQLDESDDCKLIEIDEEQVDMNEYYDGDKICFISIPIIEDENRFEDAIGFLNGDIEDALAALDNQVDYASILLRKNDFKKIHWDSFNFDLYDEIIYGTLQAEDLFQISDYNTGIHRSRATVNWMHSVSIDNDYSQSIHYTPPVEGYFYHRNGRVDVFVKNVYIGKLNLLNNFNDLYGLKLGDCKININDSIDITNVSRNGINKNSKKIIAYSIIKAVYQDILENCLESNSHKSLFKTFLDKYFSEKSLFEIS